MLALFAQVAATTLARWWAGRCGDRRGQHTLLVPSVLLAAAAAGALALIFIEEPAAVMTGVLLFRVGFSVAQNATLALMFERTLPSAYETVSALWNIAFDAGLGLGGAGFGLVAARTGYPAAFALTAALVFAALWPARYDRRKARA